MSNSIYRRITGSRELVWLFCALVLSVTALTSVTFLSDRLAQTFENNALELIASDAIIRSDKPIRSVFLEKALADGLRIGQTTVFPTMAQFGEQAKLVSLKAVSSSYPLRGMLRLKNGSTVLQRGQVWIDPQLAKILQIEIGNRIQLGEVKFTVSDFIDRELDRGASFMNFSPRVMMHEDDLAATKLLGLGSRASYRLLLAGSADMPLKQAQVNVKKYTEWALNLIEKEDLRGVQIEGMENGQPLMRKTLDQANRFLSLVALLTAMIAAVGIALTSQRYVERQSITAAVWRCFGASRGQILWSHAKHFIVVAILGGLLGIVFGWVFHELFIWGMRNLIDQDLPNPSWWPVWWGLLVSITLLFGFSGPPLLALTQVSPLQALRSVGGKRTLGYITTALFGLGSYVVLLFWIAQNFKLAGIILGAFIGGVILFGGVGYFLARYLGELFANRVRFPAGIRFAAQRFKGKPQFAAQQITTLAVAMMALLLLIVLQIDVLGAWRSSIPQNSPNRFLLNIQPDQKEGVLQLLTTTQAQLDFDLYPMIRGRLVRINQREVSSKDYQADNAKRLIDREFNLSYADKVPQKNQIVDGVWFSPGQDIKQVSIESGLMKTLQLRLGDVLVFDVAGLRYEAKITSVRKLDWNTMRVNFFAMTPSELLSDAPQSWIVAYRQEQNQRIDMDIIAAYPNITVVDTEQSLAQASSVLMQLVFAIQILFLLTLIAGLLVLLIVLAGVQDRRVREAAVLKTMGASQAFLARTWLVEFVFCGGVGGLLSGLCASITAWFLANNALEISMPFPVWIILLGFVMGVILSGLSSWFLHVKIFKVSPVHILQTN